MRKTKNADYMNENANYDQIKKNTVKADNQLKSSEYISFENLSSTGIRILFLGNSITRHGIATQIGWNHDWGMAASAKENDYVHQLISQMQCAGMDPASCICQVSKWEREYSRATEELYKAYEEARNFHADIIIQRFIENCSMEDWDSEIFQKEMERLLTYVNPSGKAKVIMTTSFWHHVGDDALREFSKEQKIPLVELGDLGEQDKMKAIGEFEHDGVAAHPGDEGMKKIAERIFEQICKAGF